MSGADEELVAVGAVAGPALAGFSPFFREHQPQVLRSAYLVVQSRELAQDVTQDAFLVAWRHWGRVQGYDRPDLWVRRVAVRLAIKAAKQPRRDREPLESDLVVGATESDVDLMAQVAALPAAQRAAIVLFYFEDRPVSEVASIMGCAEATAKVHLHRARRRLAVEMEEGT
jgi:RNA polymerase sigma-70 factor (ECF subfamily)